MIFFLKNNKLNYEKLKNIKPSIIGFLLIKLERFKHQKSIPSRVCIKIAKSCNPINSNQIKLNAWFF